MLEQAVFSLSGQTQASDDTESTQMVGSLNNVLLCSFKHSKGDTFGCASLSWDTCIPFNIPSISIITNSY